MKINEIFLGRKVGMLFKKHLMVESLLFIEDGAGKKNTKSREKTDRLRNTGYSQPSKVQCQVFYYFICTVFTEQSAAPQTALWGGPGPRFKPGTDCVDEGTLASRPPHHPYFKLIYHSITGFQLSAEDH